MPDSTFSVIIYLCIKIALDPVTLYPQTSLSTSAHGIFQQRNVSTRVSHCWHETLGCDGTYVVIFHVHAQTRDTIKQASQHQLVESFNKGRFRRGLVIADMNVRMRWYVVLSTPLTTDLSAYRYFPMFKTVWTYCRKSCAYPSWMFLFFWNS